MQWRNIYPNLQILRLLTQKQLLKMYFLRVIKTRYSGKDIPL